MLHSKRKGASKAKLSEQRARAVTRDLLRFRGWDTRPVCSGGQLFEESEYRAFPLFLDVFQGQSKTGPGFGKPDFLLVKSPNSLLARIVIDTKPSVADIDKSVRDTTHYGDALHDAGHEVLSVAVAGAEKELCAVRVLRRIGQQWKDLTLHGEPIDWIPSPEQTDIILRARNRTEVSPERPPKYVLDEQADRMNEILRECGIKDEYRPLCAATFMLALWYGDVSPDPKVVLNHINGNAKRALQKAGKLELSYSLRVDPENDALADKAWQIIDILKKLNIRSFMQEHDYLGQLYETFFKYTGGNTIGQFFTPRHIIAMMCDLVEVEASDIVFDPACGTGGFLIGALNRMIRTQNLPYSEAVKRVSGNLFGIEREPTTAALCVTNMILRGDGTTGVIKADCFTRVDYPPETATCALLNPPFPHDKKKDRPTTDFIDRGLAGVGNKRLIASVVPYSLLQTTGEWHRNLLSKNRLLFVATMPPDLFLPYSTYNTAVIIIQKGVPHRTSKTFFGRIVNDGYKLKKNTRVEREGSQIPALLEAYTAKRDIPEFTAYRTLSADMQEWSPEAFIHSEPRKDCDFVRDFEQALRNQAAFYIAHGHRLLGDATADSLTQLEPPFAGDSQISLENIPFGAFSLSDYFSINLGGKDEIEDLGDAPLVPIVSTSEFENGVTTWKTPKFVYHPPAITVATDGSTGSSFVQEYPFYAFYKVAILRPLPHLRVDTDALYFVAYLLSREQWRYVFSRKFGKSRLSTTVLYGPVRNGNPDFVKMADLTRQCRAYPVIRSFRSSYERLAKKRFTELVADWKQNRPPASSVKKMAEHDSYQKIVALGMYAVPLLLKELASQPDHWFAALHEITGNDPVPQDKQGKVDQMAEAWIKWGQERGYVG